MEKKIILYLVGFLQILVYTQAERNGATEHKVEHVSVPSLWPQVWFEMKLMKHELMSLGTTMNGIENKLKHMEERLETLEARSTDNVAEFHDTGKADIQELKEDMFRLKKGFSNEKQFIKRRLEPQSGVGVTKKENGQILEDLSAKVAELAKAVSDWSVKQETEKAQIKSINSKLADMQNQLTNSSHELLAMEKLLRLREKVTFSLRFSGGQMELPDLSNSYKLHFGEVVHQTGSGYDPKEGIFTCQESGVYLFSFTVAIGSKGPNFAGKIAAALIVDDEVKAFTISDTLQKEHEVQASNTVILSLVKDQTVWVLVSGSGEFKILGPYTTFSGTLLYN